MNNKKSCRLTANYCEDNLSFLCLWITGGLLFLLMVLGYVFSMDLLFGQVIVIPFAVFVFILIRTKSFRAHGYTVPLAAAMVIWFLLLEGYHHSQKINLTPIVLFLSVYLLAFPFAAVSRDGLRQKGLKTIAVIYIAASVALSLYAFLLMANCVPESLKIFVFWDSLRLRAVWHPNILACQLMISIAFCMGFGLKAQQRRERCLYIGTAAYLFAIMALTNCRTAIFLTCFLVCGGIFFAVFQSDNRRFLAALTAGIAVFVALVLVSSSIFRLHSFYLSTKAGLQYISPSEALADVQQLQTRTESEYTVILLSAESAAVPDPTQNVSSQKSFLEDLKNLNNRTIIWKGALEAISENPWLLLWGTDDPGAQIKSLSVTHCHNSWLEVLLQLGLPGFLLSLMFTGLAIRSSWYLLFRKDMDIWKKQIALLMLCILASSFLEPYLFTATIHYYFIHFLFFFCLGYQSEWTRHQTA